MHPPGADTVVVRFGEIGTKSDRVRGWMTDHLAENVEAIFTDREIDAAVERRRSRLLARCDEDVVDDAASAAADAFGVVTASPARVVAPTREAILDALAATAREHYADGTFAVRVHRTGDADHPFSSPDLEAAGGTAVWEAVEDRMDPEVDLDDPDLTFEVDCRISEAFVFLTRYQGPGGLPIGTQDPLVALISGGIDSPVAAYEVMRRGCPVIPVYVDLGDYGGPDHQARAFEAVRTLARYAPNYDMRVRCVPGGDAIERLVDRMDRGRMLSFRRFCFRAAEEIARKADADGIVTGEAIGQKSSQTARNLRVTGAAVDRPVHRPLLSTDKNEITEQAKAIGTFDDATIPAGCNQFVPERPETDARLSKLQAVEPDDLLAWAEAAAAETELIDLPDAQSTASSGA